MLPRLALTLALAAIVCPLGTSAAAFAQSSQPEVGPSSPVEVDTAPAHVSLVDGTATLEREGRAENPLNMPLLSGDRLKTADGRLEILFADGSTLHMDRSTTLDVQSDDLVRLIDGRVRLTILGVAEARNDAARTVAYRVDSPAGSVRITQPGDYRVAMLHDGSETQLELAVSRGAAEIFTDQGTTPVRAGERAYASAGLAPSYTYAYNSASWDAFDRWSEQRRDASLGVSTQSAQYLPTEMRSYASTFDEYGDWQYAQPYGYVWYPRVAVGWRPYYYGRWAPYPGWGWTWIGADGFGWPTHHFGRWGFSGRGWFWIPGVRWSPAWVSWGFTSGFVSWCPLGFNNVAVVSINIFNSGHFHSHFHPAWTVVARPVFGHGFVHAHAVNWDRVGTRTPFTLAHSAPVASNVAVPRGTAPVRWAGTRSLSADRGLNGVPDRSRTFGSAAPATAGASGFRSTPQAAGRQLPSSAGRAESRAGAPVRDPALSRTPSPTASPSRTFAPGNAAAAESRAVPRYINRGDQIVRSQTERPSAPSTSTSPSSMAGAPGRTGAAIERNSGARTQPSFERSPSPGGSPAFERSAPRVDRPGGMESRGVAQPRMSEPANRTVPQRVQPRGGAFDSRGGFESRSPEPRSFESRGGFESRGMAQPRMAEPRMQAPQAPAMREFAPMRQPGPASQPGPAGQPGARQAPQSQPQQQQQQPSRQGSGQAQPRSGGGGGGHRGRG